MTQKKTEPRPRYRVVHTIDHLPECPIRQLSADEIPFVGTVDKIAELGCRCFVTFKVTA